MKLNQDQVDTIEQKTGLKPLPDAAASESGLAGHFGDNSFYLDEKGIYVFEDLPPQEGEKPEEVEGTLTAIQIAAVEPADGEGVTVRGIQPQATALKIDVS